MRRLALLVPVLVALVSGVAACSEKTDGSALPSQATSSDQTTTGSTSTRTTSETPSTGSPLANKQPCSLLPSAGQSQLGISDGEEGTIGTARRCRWRLRGPQDTYLFDVLINEDVGIKDLPSGNGRDVKPLGKIGSHEAVQRTETANPGICAVILGVTDKSRVTAQVTAGTDTAKGCDLATQLATLVEPELSRS